LTSATRIADTGPVNYLILIGHINILPVLFQTVILPSAVRDELLDAPLLVKNWIFDPPSWIDVRQTVHVHDTSMETSMQAKRMLLLLPSNSR